MTQSQDYRATFLVDATPEAAYNAINNVRGWWSEGIDGRTDALGEFKYRAEELHRCTMRITELVPDQRVVWHVVDNYFSFVADEREWTGTDIVFEIARTGDQTEVRFTHIGLVPTEECYNVCSDAWGHYIKGSLRSLIMTGKGQPNINREIAEQHGIGSNV